MAKIKARDSTGKCCCGGIAGVLTCSVRGGIAYLCGMTEFSSPSLPPKMFRKKTLSGHWKSDLFTAAGCGTGDPVVSEDVAFSGSLVYDRHTCAVTNTGRVDVVLGDGTTTSGTATSATTDAGCDFTLSTSRTTRSNSTTGTCCADIDLGGRARRVTACTRKDQLDDEDTDADALTRLLAVATWTGYGQGCSASWFSRGAGEYQFTYQEAQFKLTGTTTPGTTLNAKIDLFRRIQNTSTYFFFATIEQSATADGSGHLEVTGTLPNLKGYETTAGNGRFE